MRDKIFKAFIYSGGILIGLLTLFMFITIVDASMPAIKVFGLHFLIGRTWDPVGNRYGLLPFLVGTLVTSTLALFLSIPFSISLALFSGFYHRDNGFIRFFTYAEDLLAGIPSVIYGLWGLFYLVPLIRNFEMKMNVTPFGVGIITASLILSIMIIPYSSQIIRDVIRMVPADVEEAGYALGATRLDVIFKVIFPYSRSGIFAGLLLAFGRAFGETMAVTMVIGNYSAIPNSLFSPGNTMASVIANEFTEAVNTLHLSSLIYIALWLFIISLLFNIAGRVVVKRMEVLS